MMIEERFSAAAFDQCGRNTHEADQLREQLEAEITAEMHQVVEVAFQRIADRLRQLGHALVADAPQFSTEFHTWEYSFRDIGEGRSSADHRLRIHFDTQVCTGYPNYRICEEPLIREAESPAS